MRVSVCIPATRVSSIGAAVASVQRQSLQDWELVVVGQGPEAPLRAAVEQVADGDPRVSYLHIADKGASLARNAGIQHCRAPILAFTDDDCEADPRWLEAIVALFDADPEIGHVGGAVHAPQGAGGFLTTCPENLPGAVRYDPRRGTARPVEWDWIGANFAVRRDVVDRIGGFDAAIGPGTVFPSGEDTDLKFRLEAAGVVSVTTPEAIVRHTYGVRHGVRAGLRHSRNYARGNAAMAAKLTLQGSETGPAWRRRAMLGTKEERQRDVLPHRLPVALLRRWHFERSYRHCLKHYACDATGMLIPIARPDGSGPTVEAARRPRGTAS